MDNINKVDTKRVNPLAYVMEGKLKYSKSSHLIATSYMNRSSA